jgi:hypothetical protein
MSDLIKLCIPFMSDQILATSQSCTKERSYPSLHESFDPDLQSALKASLKKELEPEFLEAIEEKRASVVLVDITNRYRPRVAALNGDEIRITAMLRCGREIRCTESLTAPRPCRWPDSTTCCLPIGCRVRN